MLDDVSEDGGENSVVWDGVLETVKPFLEVAQLFNSPLNKLEPLCGVEPDDRV